MNGLVNQARLYLKRNSATILSCAGAVGVVVTSVMAIKATPKALEKIKDAEVKKGEALTKVEKVKETATVYIPTMVAGASTIACILGSNILNKRTQASLMSAYALLDSSFKGYKDKITELYGEEANKTVREEMAKDIYVGDSAVSDEYQLFFDFHSMRYFESTMEDVLKAEYELNRRLITEEIVCLNDFYDLLEIPRIDSGFVSGWSMEAGSQWHAYSWIDFEHDMVTMNDGLECCVINMATEPTTDYNQYY